MDCGASARAVATTCASSGRPASGCSTLGSAERMRLPSPAARITTDRGGAARARGAVWALGRGMGFGLYSALHGEGVLRVLRLAGRQLRELAAHLRADEQLRIGVALVLGVLAPRDELGGLVEGGLEGGTAGERVLEEGLAEPGELALVVAAEGAVRGIRGGHHGAGVALQLIEEHPGVARRHDDHPIADAGGIERGAQLPGRQLRERQRAVLTSSPSAEPC